jgi:putative RNA 2'-phosphotransferase
MEKSASCWITRSTIMINKRLSIISKYLSKYLRHSPEDLGLTLRPGGWVPVSDLLSAADESGFPIAYDELIECVETNDKRRFSFDETGDLIRANQGHSVEVDLQLKEKEPPDLLYHGTVERFLPSIRTEGLDRGNRQHVHLSKDRNVARKVGARRGKPVILKVDAARMYRRGHRFFISANGVWLTESVPPEYLAHVSGELVWGPGDSPETVRDLVPPRRRRRRR